MKDEYDFSHAEQGKFYHPAEELNIPIYLDQENKRFFLATLRKQGRSISLNEMINALLKKDIEISKKFIR